MEPSRSHRRIHVINNCEGTGQYKTNSNIYYYYFCICFKPASRACPFI